MDEDGAGQQRDGSRGRGRTLILVFITAFIGIQFLIPAAYYARDNQADERFSWRMFSMRRAERCQLSVREQSGPVGAQRTRKIQLSSLIHEGWKSAMARRRSEVIRAFFLWRCQEAQISQVTLTRSCRDATGRPLEPDRLVHVCSPPQEAL